MNMNQKEKRRRVNMPRLYVRVSEDMNEKAQNRAKKLGFVKKNGEANISQYLRWLIENDEDSKTS